MWLLPQQLKNIPISEGFKSHAEMQLMLQSSVVFLSSQIKAGEKKQLGKRDLQMLQSKRAQLSSGIDTILITSGPADIRKAERVYQLCFVALTAKCTLQHVMSFTDNKRKCVELEVLFIVLSVGWVYSGLED